ncbi:hypothetical protein SIO70_02035 [Chitinophaga sancti]|uniref:hypothetical protein n=1 Tax=Chitinophaga sancti TaxID=1004 RepID=UPI002A74A344|nr:hypothetical protein [Chitinophaga sancti]WPQ63641.1 hypothetical protein SIO70_02035 [Chitinophaga sancti]
MSLKKLSAGKFITEGAVGKLLEMREGIKKVTDPKIEAAVADAGQEYKAFCCNDANGFVFDIKQLKELIKHKNARYVAVIIGAHYGEGEDKGFKKGAPTMMLVACEDIPKAKTGAKKQVSVKALKTDKGYSALEHPPVVVVKEVALEGLHLNFAEVPDLK